jgi:hypothetical protein
MVVPVGSACVCCATHARPCSVVADPEGSLPPLHTILGKFRLPRESRPKLYFNIIILFAIDESAYTHTSSAWCAKNVLQIL